MQVNRISLNSENRNSQNMFASVNQKRLNQGQAVSFKGGLASKAYGKATDCLATALGKYADTSFVKKTVGFINGKNYNSKVLDKIGKVLNIKQKWFQHAVALESIYLTGCYMYNTKKSKNIPEKHKRPMMVNQALVSTLCTALAYTIDSKITKVFNKAKHIFTVANVTKIAEEMKDKVALAKQSAKTAGDISNAMKLPLKTASGMSNGISKLKSVLVFGFIYRYFSPVFITPIANRISEYIDKKADKKLNKAA